MVKEEKIKQQLTDILGVTADKVSIKRLKRVFVELDQKVFDDKFEYIIKDMGFVVLSAITGLDEGDALAAMYHLSRDDGIVLSIKVKVPRDNPLLNSIIKHFPAAEAYERELVDLFGISVQGLPPGHRYPLTDDWPAGQYPLRKDWKQDGS